MKKILILFAVLISIISCSDKTAKISDNSNQDNQKTLKTGEWYIATKQINAIDEDIKTIFDDTVQNLLGVKRELMLYLGKQQLSDGINYAFICRSEITYPSALPYYEIIICNVSDSNEISIVKLEKIIESSQSGIGGIACTSSDEAKINISNSKEADNIVNVFENAVKDIKDIKYTPELYVASQAVKGINYYFISCAEFDDGSNSIKLLTINNFMESSEVIEVKNIL
ncbi:hypothetical protein [Brachyspira hampsonii]|uniref:Lipoprotein n=1 Tax=Brachyspira hampsonii 30446 TaxID=1289135 RepID=A0A2U4F2H6_9SPIR|nr:hypothetical protein [Brachyspira hampsonii]EKV57529.1 hypothetical protein A966_05271 [Brachyspira hampsonii 30446]MBW5390449.1 hypothetical protein [Brachyspira hampsonii]MBW5394511.1 hypothetical protein [Brachyspira hampsonii]OEJ20510.1 hypothetical protein A9495_11765 [Brachyspira hampsonii]